MARIRQASNGNPVLTDGTLDSLVAGDIVITTPNDCTAVECHLLAERGVLVIVLAPVIRDFDRQRYLDAGAKAYLPMLVDTAELVAALRGALEDMPMAPMRAVCRN